MQAPVMMAMTNDAGSETKIRQSCNCLESQTGIRASGAHVLAKDNPIELLTDRLHLVSACRLVLVAKGQP